MENKETYLIMDPEGRMQKHKCEWDSNHIERPERLVAIMNAIKTSGLIRSCIETDPISVLENDILLVHSEEYLKRLKEATTKTIVEQETFSSEYEDIYVNSSTLDAAYMSLGSALRLTEIVIEGKGYKNAFGVIRPPGHHAYQDKGCGFCIFNNVAVCAKKARANGLNRVLIVDWDVHAGQGTQYCIEGDPGIKLVSIHRFQQGHFWPNLPESAIKSRFKNTANVPLNDVGYGDAEYFAFMNALIRPIVEDWRPELILVSCGFDAALGDPEGEMEVTPAGFGYLAGLLATYDIPLCVLLEGGYFLPSIARDAVHVLRALVERRPSPFQLASITPVRSFLKSLYSTIHFHRDSFSSLYDISLGLERFTKFKINLNDEYQGTRVMKIPYQTRDLYPPRAPSIEEHFRERLEKICENYESHLLPKENLHFKLEPKKIVIKVEQNNDFQMSIASHSVAKFFYFLCLPLLTHDYDVYVDSIAWYNFKFADFIQTLMVDREADDITRFDFKKLVDIFPILDSLIL